MLTELVPRQRVRMRVFLFGAVAALALTCMAHAEADERAHIRTFESSFCPAVTVVGSPESCVALQARMTQLHVPGMSIAIIRDGKLAWAKGYGVLQAGGAQKVDTDTVFSVGSVSKLGAAALSLRLVDAGKLSLDRDVNDYLHRWRVPENGYTAARPVTLRGILSHTAGLTVHGFLDFAPEAKLPTVIDTLEGHAPASNEPVRVVALPGQRFMYSGGGTTIEQQIIEETTGLEFTEAARNLVFGPLGMVRSTYQNPLPESFGNIAKAHDDKGQPKALPRGYESMPELAASGLWSTPKDYAKLMIALMDSYRNPSGGFLSAPLAQQMMTEVGPGPVGLGPFMSGAGVERRFSHSGSNDSYKAWIEGHLGTRNGVVIFTNGENGRQLYQEARRAVAIAEGWSPALSYRLRVPETRLSRKSLEDCVGVYESRPASDTLATRRGRDALVFRIRYQDGSLRLIEGGGRNEMRLIPEDAARFVVESDVTLRVEFVRNYSGQVEKLILRGDTYVIEAKRGVT